MLCCVSLTWYSDERVGEVELNVQRHETITRTLPAHTSKQQHGQHSIHLCHMPQVQSGHGYHLS